MNKQNSKFNFFIPSVSIQKGQDGKGKDVYEIEGICSTDDEDSDGETLIPAGYDFGPLLKNGFFNWNHQSATKPKSIVGEPTEAKIVNDGRGLYVKGFLYPTKEGQDIVELAETLEKYSPNRRLGFSIEGQATERDPLNKKKVLKARITGIAITQNPKNTNTLMSIVKGEYADSFVEEEDEEDDMDKAMTVNPDINPESVEGARRGKKVLKQLEKSEIYGAIIDRFAFESNAQIDQVFDLVNLIHIKMSKTNVTQESLSKAFSILEDGLFKGEADGEFNKSLDQENDDQEDDEKEVAKGEESFEEEEKEDEVAKGEESDDEESDDESEEDDDEELSDDDMEKAETVVDLVKGLVTGDQTVMMSALGQLGVNVKLVEYVCKECVTAASNLKANGGEISGGSITKGEIAEMLGSYTPVADNAMLEGIDAKFSAFGTILKSLVEGQDLLKGEISQVLSQPVNGRKSTMSSKAIERFPEQDLTKGNSAGGVQLSRNNGEHIKIVGDKLAQRFDLLKSQGTSDNRLEKAITELDIAKSTNFNAIADHIQAIGVNIVD